MDEWTIIDDKYYYHGLLEDDLRCRVAALKLFMINDE